MRLDFAISKLAFKVMNDPNSPSYLHSTDTSHLVIFAQTDLGRTPSRVWGWNFSSDGKSKVFNNLPANIRGEHCTKTFVSLAKSFYFEEANETALIGLNLFNFFFFFLFIFLIFSFFRSSHRDSFRKYLFFFSRSNLFIIFQESPFVRRTDMNFPGGLIEKTCFSKMLYLFVEQTSLSHRTHTNFPGASYASNT